SAFARSEAWPCLRLARQPPKREGDQNYPNNASASGDSGSPPLRGEGLGERAVAPTTLSPGKISLTCGLGPPAFPSCVLVPGWRTIACACAFPGAVARRHASPRREDSTCALEYVRKRLAEQWLRRRHPRKM